MRVVFLHSSLSSVSVTSSPLILKSSSIQSINRHVGLPLDLLPTFSQLENDDMSGYKVHFFSILRGSRVMQTELGYE